VNPRKGFPWAVWVLTAASAARAQSTVAEEPGPANDRGRVVQAARDRRSISLSSDALTPAESPELVPEFHVVERGDTLWDITGRYLQDPWQWPAVWGLNPQITNPHWIFPGDQVRLLSAEQVREAATPQSHAVSSAPPNGNLPRLRPQRVLPRTVFLRDEGWLDREDAQSAGTIVGSPEDQMLLSEGDQAYVEFPRRTPRIGEEFTIYQDAQGARGGDRNSGHVVRVLGTARVEAWNRDRHLATVRIGESVDTIERGERVAAIPRRLEQVPPVRNAVDLRAHIVATVQPRELLGQNMVVFLDRGAEDHVVPGNRFFVLRRGDAWRHSLTTAADRAVGTGLDRDGDGNVDSPPGHAAPDRDLPEEIVGEVLVVQTRPRSATALVTSSITEVEVGDVLEMRRGY
jgi:hypothetical protein